MKEYLNFTGKTVIVTGGRRGIGRAISLAFAERNANVAVVAGSADGNSILEEIRNVGGNGRYYCCDLGNEDARKGLIDRIAKDMGNRVDVLINNAGMQFLETVEECTTENWKCSERVLLDAPCDLSRQAIPYMKKQGGGKIIMISSICAYREGAWNFSYAVMKAGVSSMARSMANHLAKFNINVNAIAPGIIRTPLTESQGCFSENKYKALIQKYPAGRLGEPDEIATAALFLASSMSSFVNGHLLVVDGGFSGN